MMHINFISSVMILGVISNEGHYATSLLPYNHQGQHNSLSLYTMVKLWIKWVDIHIPAGFCSLPHDFSNSRVAGSFHNVTYFGPPSSPGLLNLRPSFWVVLLNKLFLLDEEGYIFFFFYYNLFSVTWYHFV